MAKKNDPSAPGYEVGYGKPPKHTRFQAGRSGNPNGRPKGVNNLKSDVLRVLREPVKVRAGDKVRTISTQEATIRKLREKALNGDARALDRLIDLATRHNNEPAEHDSSVTRDRDEDAVLNAFVARVKASALRDAAADHTDRSAEIAEDEKVA